MKLGYNLIDYLIDLITLRDEEEDAISAQALECLVSNEENLIIKIFSHKKKNIRLEYLINLILLHFLKTKF